VIDADGEIGCDVSGIVATDVASSSSEVCEYASVCCGMLCSLANALIMASRCCIHNVFLTGGRRSNFSSVGVKR